ncbi:MAG: hypothetical protein EOP83_14015 [Verrucomicrobiaceae bacterium]|nr:MAG: hypothetical protein EOP83_14015 [Verrucomicrobiaceae bacterium]
MIQPLSYHLLRIEWQGFVTLTFGPNWSAKKTRNKVERVFAWLRRIVRHHTGSKSLQDVLFVASEELGEMGDRYHVHMLIGGLPRKITKSDCFAMSHAWKVDFRGGFAKIRPYSPTLRGVDYVLKTLSLSDLRGISSETSKERVQHLAGAHVGSCPTTYTGANAYEVGKIGAGYEQGLMVMVSHGCTELMCKRVNSRLRKSAKAVDFFKRRSKRQAAANTVEKTAGAARSGSRS